MAGQAWDLEPEDAVGTGSTVVMRMPHLVPTLVRPSQRRAEEAAMAEMAVMQGMKERAGTVDTRVMVAGFTAVIIRTQDPEVSEDRMEQEVADLGVMAPMGQVAVQRSECSI